MIVITPHQFAAVEAGAVERKIALVATRLDGPDAGRVAAARAAVEVGHRHGLDRPESFVLLGEIMLHFGPEAVENGAAPWVAEMLVLSGGDRDRRLRECWAIARAASGR